MTPSSNPIERSFELAAAACDDLMLSVYRRLFREHPEAQAMFRTEGSEPVRGSMLSLTIQAIIDFAGERRGHFRLIESEVFSHDAYGTPRELFVAFFAVIADCLREILGEQWSDEIDAAWHKLLRDIAAVVQQKHLVDDRA
ncbi:globin [Bradyrhizobium sp. 2S1]|uniref:globin n=1 Tax=Bradyrhizobium sp. 2S1 TaxID=1404429 RepID=UPI0014077323|nr:globin [Bradyrhizobium sp. 2S1]MCK7669814.1 globin [Bradyrhizobium sp. 2S1]